MAAVIKAINAKIRSNKVLDYVCSTLLIGLSQLWNRMLTCDNISIDFWGPVSNFGIPVAAVMDTQKDPEMYVIAASPLYIFALPSGPPFANPMTGALVIYSGTFMRYSLAVTPKNYLLFGCHFINFGAQLTQGYRWLNYWKWGGREAALANKAKEAGAEAGKVAVEPSSSS
ncbi:UPF0041 domain-containing protein [Microsporum canis CBS 113480]|uniref:Mitochondrial pyruvate carrier n=1 Tax=Arthroderma otae (strain ATCC MYA-4605 / CBS 113480) TaxID=554155 RepID=C5FWR5_ARTOC|nr:UPF0041 domain-containing protein [Microsporum canis CBS 113480]EEQ33322.1 UPF0041 domain-containing protein [Microsporum canis CBS 113480]